MVTLSHPTTNNNVREVARALVEAGLLGSFHTCIAPCGGNFLDRVSSLPGLGEIRRRQCREDLRGKLRLHPWREGLRLLTKRCGLLDPLLGEFTSIDRVYASLDRAVARYIDARPQVAAVYCYEDGAFQTFAAAKKIGAACIYDLPIAYWRTARRIVEEERDRLPAWAPTLEALRDNEAKLECKEQELALADTVMCPSRFVEDSLPEAARRGKRVFVAPFGSPVGPGCAHAEAHFRKTKLKVLFVGSMSQRKGLADLFAAMRSLDPARFELHVLGSPVAEPSFYRSQFEGFVHHAGRSNREVMELMSSCHVFVLPSLVEGRALVQQEAMACGLPIVVTRNAGGEDLVEDGGAGFLVPIRDPQAIAEKLSLLERSRDMLQCMSQSAQAKAADLTWSAYRLRVAEAVQDILSRRRPALLSTADSSIRQADGVGVRSN